MESLDRELTLEIPHNIMNFDTLATHFFNSATDSSAKAAVQLLNSTPKAAIISSSDFHLQHQRSPPISNQFLQKLGETLFGFSGQSVAVRPGIGLSNSDLSNASNMDLLRNHIVIDSGGIDAIEKSDLQQQLEYDKFMNEIWIGIVLTLIIISLVFCICSCFLYHQFRQWKRNYRNNLHPAQDIESVKLNPDCDDPVPEYTLVSGLPSYEAALELMQKSTALLPSSADSSSCLIVYPSLFNVFSLNEKDSLTTQSVIPQLPSIHCDATRTPTISVSQNVKCQSVPRLALHSIPSYEEATTCPPHTIQLLQNQQQPYHIPLRDSSTCLMKSPVWCEDTTNMVKKN